jgi:hypothetical protein
MIRLPVEFNDLDEQGRLLVLVELAPEPPDEGERAYLFDDEGNSCWGTVSSIDGDLIRVDADWDTWQTDGPVETGAAIGATPPPQNLVLV